MYELTLSSTYLVLEKIRFISKSRVLTLVQVTLRRNREGLTTVMPVIFTGSPLFSEETNSSGCLI